METLVLFLGISLSYSTPLVFGALGGVVSERSGVTNIGIEGMMVIGAISAAVVTYLTGNPWLGLLAAGFFGGLMALPHAFISISLAGDQTISGVAINLLAPGIALFVCRTMFDGGATTPIVTKLPRIFGASWMRGTVWANLNVYVTTVLALVLTLLLWFVLYRTKWGLRIRAVGEHPAAADTLGIDVYRTRYACVLISGMLAGLGGASMTTAVIAQFTPVAISGQGFIALAAVIFGKWTPHGACAACLLFGAAQALSIVLGGTSFAIAPQLLAMVPYALTLLALVLFVGKSQAPKASGTPYLKDRR
jgi:simple sugar transport system permease protein